MRGAIHFDDGWFEALDEKAIKFLIDGGLSKDNVSEAVVKYSPMIPSREDVYNMVSNYTRMTACCR